jgi:hypothetical protein
VETTHAAVYLVSDESHFVIGTSLAVDAGILNQPLHAAGDLAERLAVATEGIDTQEACRCDTAPRVKVHELFATFAHRIDDGDVGDSRSQVMMPSTTRRSSPNR